MSVSGSEHGVRLLRTSEQVTVRQDGLDQAMADALKGAMAAKELKDGLKEGADVLKEGLSAQGRAVVPY